MRNSLLILGIIAVLALRVGINNESGQVVYEKESYSGLKQYWAQRLGRFTSSKEFTKTLKRVRKDIERVPKRRSLGLDWKELGPDNIGGRVRALLIDNENPNLMYAGGVSGGLWYSNDAGLTWNQTEPGDVAESLTVTSITQDKDGFIYYGTGEGVFLSQPSAQFPVAMSSSFRGKGIFKSTAPHGVAFEHLESSWNGIEEYTVGISVLKSDGNGNVYAGGRGKLFKSTNGGTTWEAISSLSNASEISGDVFDVQPLSNGSVLLAMGGAYYMSPNGSADSFEQISGPSEDLTPANGRSVFAVAPSASNVIYMSRADYNEEFNGLFRSKDFGESWEVIIGGGSDTFEPFHGQGDYNQSLAVFPDNPDKILLGGLDVYEWQEGGNWIRLSDWKTDWGKKNYVHADVHAFVFSPGNSESYYIATDGGIFQTKDGGEIFQRLNRGLNVTQFFGVGFGGDGVVLAGTQDNSNIYFDFDGNTQQSGDIHNSGDGGYSSISNLIPDAFFLESQFGKIKRDNSRSNAYLDFFSHPTSFLTLDYVDYNSAWSEFVTPFVLWESNFDSLVPDSSMFIADKDYLENDFLTFNSNINGLTFNDTIGVEVSEGDTIKVKVPKQSMFVYGTHQALYITRNAIDFSTNPTWIELSREGCKVASNPQGVTAIAVSNDGDEIYYGTNRGLVYRVSNVSKVLSGDDVSNATVTLIGDFDASGGSDPNVITDIAVDPNDKEHVIVSVGFYDQTTNIYKSTNAASTTDDLSFTSIAGNLPSIPVYSVLIELNTGAYLIGTEYGLYSSEDGGGTWFQEVDGPPQCPVAMLRQQTFKWAENRGEIFVATHGRGIFSTDHYVTSINEASKNLGKLNLDFFPNPVSNVLTFKVPNLTSDNLIVQVIDMKGGLVLSKKQKDQQINIAGLSNGSYMISVQSGRNIYTSKFIKK